MMSSDPANTLPPDFDDALPRDYDPAYTADISTKMRVPDVIGVKGDRKDGLLQGTVSERLHNGSQAANMNVPDKIIYAVKGASKADERLSGHETEILENKARTAHMLVPEKLIYQGNNESHGMRKEPELHLDLDIEHGAEKYIGLSTPPRHLTIEEAYRHEIDRQGEQVSFDESGLPDEPPSYSASRGPAMPNGYTPSPQHTRDSRVEEAALRTPTRDPLMTPGSAPYTPSVGGDDMLILRKQIDRLSRHVMRLEQENQRRSSRELLLYPMVAVCVLATLMRFLK